MKKRILIIEPNTIFAQIYSETLNKIGYETIIVQGAQEAIFAADKKIPDAVILEIQLPNHNGIEFLYEFRSYPEWQSIPVIINSSIPYVEFKDYSVSWSDLSIDTYLYKPKTKLSHLIKVINDQVPLVLKKAT